MAALCRFILLLLVLKVFVHRILAQPRVNVVQAEERKRATARIRRQHIHPLGNAETGEVLFKQELYDPNRLQLLELKEAEFAVHAAAPGMETTERRGEDRRREHNPGRHSRQKRWLNESGAAAYSTYTVESSLHVLDVYPRPAKVAFKMMSSYDQSERLNVDNLDYGAHYQSWSQLSLSDKFNAEARLAAGAVGKFHLPILMYSIMFSPAMQSLSGWRMSTNTCKHSSTISLTIKRNLLSCSCLAVRYPRWELSTL